MNTHASNGDHERVELFMQELAESVPHDRARLPSAHFLWVRATMARETERRERAAQAGWIIDSLLVLIALAGGLLWGLSHVGAVGGRGGQILEGLAPAVDPMGVVVACAALSLILAAGASRALWAVAR